MQGGFQRRLRALFQSCGQALEPLSELLDSFPCVIFLLCLPLRHLHNNHDRVRTDVTLPDSHTHAHAGGRGEHTVCSTYSWCQQSSCDLTVRLNHTRHTSPHIYYLLIDQSRDDGFLWAMYGNYCLQVVLWSENPAPLWMQIFCILTKMIMYNSLK